MEYIDENKKEFISLVNSISENRLSEDARNKLINWLENKSDFFTAPASIRYNSSFDGGLCLHSLQVYYILKDLVNKYLPGMISEDSVKIVSLFHDISKANFYEKYSRNVKNASGVWTSVEEYRVIDPTNRFIYGNHEQTSEFMIRAFIDLSVEESIAILHHHGGKYFDSTQVDISNIFESNGLSVLLHTADLIATYISENGKYNTIN